LGCIGDPVHLYMNPEAIPVQLPVRKMPLAIVDQVKGELDRLVTEGIIVPVTEPTPWVSALLILTKKDGNIRVCIDPKPLNAAMFDNDFYLKSIEDILPNLTGSTKFAQFDLSAGFHQCELDEPSSFLTTFGTVFGRYRWKRLPFGIKSAPKEFYRRVTQCFDGLRGLELIADDILVHGTDENFDQRLEQFLIRAREKRVKLNRAKIAVGEPEIKYIGHTISSQGVAPDGKKVEAIKSMPTPTDKLGVKRLLGMLIYLEKFIPHLSQDSKPLRELLKEDVEFTWDDQIHGQAFSRILDKVANATTQSFFDPKKTTVLQCDASCKGLGATLMQEGQPLLYSSRALTPAETNYSQIEKEMLAMLYGLEKFDVYTYGRKIQVQSDHKPLEIITKKPVSSAPKRLQAMLVRCQRYHFEVTFTKGTSMYIADTLSRAFIPSSPYQNENEKEFEQVCELDPSKVTGETASVLRKHTKEDPVFQSIIKMITDGWPEKAPKQAVIAQYYHCREVLIHEEGLIFKGSAVCVPNSALPYVRKRLIHLAHVDPVRTLSRARELVFWPLMTRDIQEWVANCDPCNATKPQQQKETLMPEAIPDYPWEMIAMDFADLNNKLFLITVDRYSDFFEVDEVPSTSAQATLKVLRPHFARYGSPRVIISDNGTPFNSREFSDFCAEWNIEHRTSAPTRPQGNGKAESAVKSAKTLLKRVELAQQDLWTALLEHRNTRSSNKSSSPAQRLLSRCTRSPANLSDAPMRKQFDHYKVADELTRNQELQKDNFDRHARDLPGLQIGDTVRMPHPNRANPLLVKAKVTKVLGPRDYMVSTETGSLFRRNRQQLRKTEEGFQDLDWYPDNPEVELRVEAPNAETAPETNTEQVSPSVNPESPRVDLRRSTRVHQSARQSDYIYQ
jgi:hypothetical protein